MFFIAISEIMIKCPPDLLGTDIRQVKLTSIFPACLI